MLYHPALIKGLSPDWDLPCPKINLTVDSSSSDSAGTQSVARGMSLNGALDYTPPADDTDTSPPQPTFYDTVDSVVDADPPLAAGSLVAFESKTILDSGVEDETGFSYLDIIDDPAGMTSLRVYYDPNVFLTAAGASYINYVSGQLQDNGSGTLVLDCNSGPSYDCQLFVGILQPVGLVEYTTGSPIDTIPSVLAKPNGSSVNITNQVNGPDNGKIVTATNSDFPGYIYIEEPSRSNGIRVNYTDTAGIISRGSKVLVTGTVSTGADGEREIEAGTSGVSIDTPSTAPLPNPLGISNVLLGGQLNGTNITSITTPPSVGCYNRGLLARILGQVQYVDTTHGCFYIYDGSHLSGGYWLDDGTHSPSIYGVKVDYGWPTGKTLVIPPQVGWYVSVVGISGSESPSQNNYIRVLRPRGQSDLGLYQPEDHTNPQVDITSPPGTQVFEAPGATSVILSGSASDADTMVVSVDVQVGTGQWQVATYDSASQNWSFVWQNPQAATVTVRATDFAGNSATVSRDFSIITYDTAWLHLSAYVTRYDEVQASWSYPSSASTLEYAVGTSPGIDDVSAWAATASPATTQVSVDGLDLNDNTTYYFSLKGLKTDGSMDRIASCPFVVDLGADSIALEASPSTNCAVGGSVTVTATLTDCQSNPVSGRSVTFETTGSYDSTTAATTDVNGHASLTFSCNLEGSVNVAAREYQPGLANVEQCIDIEFAKPPLVEVLFLIEGNTAGFFNDLVRDTAYYGLWTYYYGTGMPVKFGCLCFDDLPCTPPWSYPFTDDYYAFNDWLEGLVNSYHWDCFRSSVTWEALGGLAQASGMFDQEATQKYVAVATSNKYLRCGEDPSSWYNYCYTPGGCYDKPTVVQMLQNAGCQVYVDRWALTGATYNDLAVNGAVEDSGSWGYPKMLNSIDSYANSVLYPSEPDYGNPQCDPGEGDFGDDLQAASMFQQSPTLASSVGSFPVDAVPIMISTNPDLEQDPSRRYPYHDPSKGVYQIEDGVMHVTFSGLRPLPPKQPFYRFVVRDPADESPYAKRTGGKKADGDNFPTGTGDYGVLDAPGFYHQNHIRVVWAAPDSEGKVTLTLRVTNQYSGNNYQIQMTPVGDPHNVLASSPVMVAWKRTYLEIDRMYRQPGFNQDAQHSPSSDIANVANMATSRIGLDNNSNFKVGDDVIVFDAAHPQGEHHFIQAKGDDGDGPFVQFGDLLQQSYYGGYGWTGLGGAVVEANATYFTDDLMGRIKEAYGDIHDPTGATHVGCFVDFRQTAHGNNLVPYELSLDTMAFRNSFQNVWFQNKGAANAVYLPLVDTVSLGGTPVKGLSLKSQHWSYISWRKADTGNEAQDIQASAAHELCHEFIGNAAGEGTDEDHPSVPAWSWTKSMPKYSRRCVMEYHNNPGIDQARSYDSTMPCQFCVKHLLAIRQAQDPL